MTAIVIFVRSTGLISHQIFFSQKVLEV